MASGSCATYDVRPRHPKRDIAVVLVHGYCSISRAFYWRGLLRLRRELSAAGWPVFTSRVARTGRVAARAQQLALFLDDLPARRLLLIGHSMGGLDARYVASRLDRRRRIGHVVTVGTPHRGTSVAEWILRDTVWRSRLFRFFDRGALRDLSPEGAARLDVEMPDRPDVTYSSIAGAYPVERLTRVLRRFGEQIALDEGANDGVVSLRSAARWPHTTTVDADHLELIGQTVWTCVGGVPRGHPRSPMRALRRVLDRVLTIENSAPMRVH
jgi:triacylglycerol lipase